MDLQLVKKGFDFGRKKKKWVFLLTALGFTGYGAYRVYNLPSVAKRRRKVLKLLGALVSVAEAVSDSAGSIGIVSKDLREFLQSDSDQIPNSLRQLSKIAKSDELSTSLIRLTQGLTMGVLRGYQSEKEKAEASGEAAVNSGLSERVLEKVFSPAGSGFASIVVGSFARNLVLGLYSASSQGHAIGEPNPKTAPNANGFASKQSGPVPEWMDAIFSDKFRDLIGGCIQVFVSTAVSVYLEKTMDVNTYDELFSGLTNPRHDTKVRDMFVSVCNGAVETLVRTSHEVLTRPSLKEDLFKPDSGPPVALIEEVKDGPIKTPETDDSDQESESQSDNDENDSGRGRSGGWVSKVSSTLAVPSNRRLVLDVTGRVTFETVRSFLEFLLEKLHDGAWGCANAFYEAVVERGLRVVRYIAAKSSVIATICLSLCLHASGSSAWLLMPA